MFWYDIISFNELEVTCWVRTVVHRGPWKKSGVYGGKGVLGSLVYFQRLFIFFAYGAMGRDSDSLRAGRSGDRIPVGGGGGEIFRTRSAWPWGPPSLLYNGYRVFPGDKAAGTWC
jgi:hypothetical protein